MTNEEAMRVLKTMRADADVHANVCGVHLWNRVK